METTQEATPFKIAVTIVCCLFPFLFAFFFIPQIGLALIPCACAILLVGRSTRIHGWLILGAIGYLIADVLMCKYAFGSPPWELAILGGIRMFAVRFLPEIIVIFGSFWSIMLGPIILFEFLYWITHYRKWAWLTASVCLAVVLSVSSLSYASQCVDHFNTAYSLRGQTMSKSELFQQCGKPLYFRNNALPHWVYTDGNKVLGAVVQEDGTVTIRDRTYWFLDL